MEKREAEAAAAQGVSSWIAFVFHVTEHLVSPSFLFPFQADR